MPQKRIPFKAVLLILLLPVAFLFIAEIHYFNTAYPNTFLGSINVSGKNRREIENIITQEAQNRQEKTLSFSINKSKYISIKLDKNLLTYDIQKTTDQVMNDGHTGTILERLKNQVMAFNTQKKIKPVYNFDNFTFDTLLADSIRIYEKPVIETQLIYTSTGPALSPSKPGLEADRDQALAKVYKYLNFEEPTGVIELQLEEKNPRTTRENSQDVLALAKQALSRPITLFSPEIPDKTWTLEAPEIYDFLEIKYDQDLQKPKLRLADYKVASYSAQFSSLVKKEAKEAKYETVGSKIVVFEPSQDGRELDTEKLTLQLTQALFSAAPNNRIELPLKTVKPALAFNTLNQYGIKEIIATGKSHFQGSSPARIHNIETAAQKLNGTLIKSGEVFSMYKAIGNIEKTTGFEDSYVIKNGRTVVGVGGGVCQVSTTLFRAALNAGFKINERHPHSYRVKYYEQDAPPGFDAAIFFPQTDFKFTNNTDNYALIQTKIDKSTSELTFNIYGVKDGRNVEFSSTETTNQIEPPKEVRIVDATIPKGITRQTEYAAQGSDITFTRKVTKNGKEISNDKFTSHYYPWQAVFLIGAQTN